MTKLIITGANGQLGSEIRKSSHLFPDLSFVFTDLKELDITNPEAVESFFAEEKPQWLINCAAYTAVDKAESEEETAWLINAVAPAILAEKSKAVGCRFVQVSTDYVFDGKNYRPYVEEDEVCPTSIYGHTKLEGELISLTNNPQSMVIRTSWLYSSFGNNFVKSMIKLGKERDQLNVIFDQVGTPTYAGDLAMAILEIIQKTESGACEFVPGTYHYSNEGVCSWYDFALAIHQIYGINCQVSAIESKDYLSPVTRPPYSVLNKSKIKSIFGIQIPYWRTSLEKCIFEIKN
ncbi:MAG TPA: dTDP-4-dehydrorhamnose reductase [Prolixibacteraceae bacterium]|jgi:dTDP-4-dehydrorhamnose reductase|nr:dTDP-4-dehydrorhamnose reductase [Prolixibacteraceae bacterium]